MEINKKALGDFQTPLELSIQIITLLKSKFPQQNWNYIFEPTCGTGSFFRAIKHCEIDYQQLIGVEIQSRYVAIAQEYGSVLPDLHIIHGDMLNLELASIFTAPAHSKILVVGNPPWVTNAELGGLNYDNLPEKTNFTQLSGLDALTGHSNFDIAEYIIIKLIHELSHSDATIALICKTGVARNVIRYCYDKNLAVSNLAMYQIDAKKWWFFRTSRGEQKF